MTPLDLPALRATVDAKLSALMEASRSHGMAIEAFGDSHLLSHTDANLPEEQALDDVRDFVTALLDRLEAAEKVVVQYDNVLSTVRDHLQLCVVDGNFAAYSQETVDGELLRLRAMRKDLTPEPSHGR